MLKLQHKEDIKLGILNSLPKLTEQTIRFFLSKEGYLIGRYFNCRCGHFMHNHRDKSKNCLVPNCSLMCFCFVPKGIEIKTKSNFTKNPLSLDGFEDFLRLKMIPVPIRGTKIWFKLWEKHIRIYK
jgi:hypothetical protein